MPEIEVLFGQLRMGDVLCQPRYELRLDAEALPRDIDSGVQNIKHAKLTVTLAE